MVTHEACFKYNCKDAQMKAVTPEDQQLVEYHQAQRIDKIRKAIGFLIQVQDSNDQQEKHEIMMARELVFDSCQHTLVVIDGLRLRIINEESDRARCAALHQVSDTLYDLYCSCYNGTANTSRKTGLQQVLDVLKNIN